jgi:hypothetical protein
MKRNIKNNNKRKSGAKSIDGIIRRPPLLKKRIETKPESPLSRGSIYSGLKVMGVFALSLLLFVSFSSVGGTVSYFSDIEISSWNKLQAGILGFNIFPANDAGGRFSVARIQSTTTPENPVEENTGNKQFNITVGENDGSLAVSYTVSGELDPSNSKGCDKMEMTAGFGDYNYSGLLNSFASTQISEMGEWSFLSSLPEHNKDLDPKAVCKGEIIFRAGLAGVAEDLMHTFSDEKRYKFEVVNWDKKLDEEGPTVRATVLDTVGVSEEPEEEREPEAEPEVKPEIETVETPSLGVSALPPESEEKPPEVVVETPTVVETPATEDSLPKETLKDTPVETTTEAVEPVVETTDQLAPAAEPPPATTPLPDPTL